MPLFGGVSHSRGASRWPQPYKAVASSDPEDDSFDIEKRYDSDEDIESSQTSGFSSRVSSGTHQPMIRRVSRARSRPALFTIRSPASFSRIFTLAIGATLIIFIL